MLAEMYFRGAPARQPMRAARRGFFAKIPPPRPGSTMASGQGRIIMITGKIATAGAALAVIVFAAPAMTQDLSLPRQSIELVAPPFVHPHEQATSQGPKIIEVRLVTEEKEIVIDDEGTKLQAMSFNGSIPAPLIVVHEGDYVEVTLVNPETNTMPHNI